MLVIASFRLSDIDTFRGKSKEGNERRKLFFSKINETKIIATRIVLINNGSESLFEKMARSIKSMRGCAVAAFDSIVLPKRQKLRNYRGRPFSHEIRFRNFIESWRGRDPLSEIRLVLRGRQTVKQASKTAITREGRGEGMVGGGERKRRERERGKGRPLSPRFSTNALRRDYVPTGGSHY